MGRYPDIPELAGPTGLPARIQEDEAGAAIGVSGRMTNLELVLAKAKLIPRPEWVVCTNDPRRSGHRGQAACSGSECTRTGDVVGMYVGVHTIGEVQTQGAEAIKIPLDLLEHGVDEDGVLAVFVCQQVCVGACLRVEELFEDHAPISRGIPLSALRPRPDRAASA